MALYNTVMKINILPPVQEKLLLFFLEKPDEKKYINELIRLTGEYPNSIQFALKALEKSKLLKSESVNRKKFYWLNKSSSNLKVIKDIYGKKSKTSSKDQKPRWIKLLNRDASLAFQAEVPLINRDILPKVVDYQINNFWFNGITHGVYYREDELHGLADAIQLRIKNDPEFAQKNIDDCYKLGKNLIAASKVGSVRELKKLNNKQLLNLLNKFRDAYLTFLPYLVYPHSIERYFLAQIKKELEETLSHQDLSHKLDEYFQLLTTPTIHEIEQQVDMLHLADKLRKNGWSKEVKKGLKEIHSKYAWQTLWTIEAEPLDINYFKDALKALSDSKEKGSLIKEANKIVAEQEQRGKRLGQVLKKIKASKNLFDLVNLLQAYMYLRTYRKNIISQAQYLHLPLIDEIGKRMKLSEYIKLVTYEEMQVYLKNRKIPSIITLKNRERGWGVISFDGKIQVISGLEAVLEVMEQFQIGNNPIPKTVQQKIAGSPACRGKVTGNVRVIKNISELAVLEKGDILVTRMTTPDFVPALGKVKAIVTDEGGVTCHAAIVSREFGIPCIVGTKNATQVLGDGDKIEVDANNGVITILGVKTTTHQDDTIQGKTLYGGRVKGVVVNVNSEEDLAKVSSESIIVSNVLTPRFLSALYKAKGFIIDEYSPTSHGYLYAQTIKIPSLGGTKNASEILKTGDKVELDASKEFVRLL